MFKSFLCSILFLLLELTLGASFNTNVHSISRREGLSNGAVNTIIKDSEGYIWFGTWNGLNRYDGSNIVSYLPGSTPFSIHNHVIREIYPTHAGPVWMLTNKGVSLYDNKQSRFYSFFTQEPGQINYETDISLSHSEENGTMASVFGQGIFRYDTTKKEFIQFNFDAASLPLSQTVKRIHLIGSESFCITSSGELLRISGDHLDPLIQLPQGVTFFTSTSIVIGNHPFILITQRASSALMIDIDRKEVSQLHIPDDIITSFSLSKDKNRIWTGTEKGKIYSFNIATRKFEILSTLSDLFISNPIATRILSIYETDQDILWIGTDGNGVFNLNLFEFPYISIPSEQLSYPIVRCILVTRKNDILIGTKGGGVDIFNSSGHHIQVISVKNGLSNNSVLSLHERQDGSIWIGTDGKGVDIISPDYKHIRNFPRDFDITGTPGFASVYSILEDNDNRLYLGTSGFGVIMIEFDKNQNSVPVSYEQLRLDKNFNVTGEQKQIVYAVTSERPGVIWVGTRGIGVFRYNTITKRVMANYSTLTHPRLVHNDDILSLLVDENRKIWIGSSGGIFGLALVENDSIEVPELNISAYLSGATIHTMQQDKQGNLWVTTNRGISCIDILKGNVRSFNVNDGLINYEYSDGASYFDNSTSQLYVGGTMGVDIIQTDKIRFSSFFPPIAINDLYIRNQPVEIGEESVLKNCINHQKKLVLKYSQNALTFYVSPLVYWGKERHLISYRLINFDNNWVTNLPGQAINFTNLSPGSYNLQLRVSDENGNWSDKIREIEIIIKPPLWRTAVAFAVYFLLIIVMQFFIFNSLRKKEARKKEALLLEFKQKKEEELQSYKIEFFTNVAHEFRTPLTLITSHIQALIEDTRNPEENPRLLKVYKNSIKLQKLVLEIMQFRKLEKGKEPLNIQITKPVELIREVVSDLELPAQKGNISCVVISSSADIIFRTDADKFQRIFTNLISNAIKYNKPGGYVKATINLKNSLLTVEIEDSGVGISPEHQQKVFEPFGISSAQNRRSFPAYRSTGLGLAVTKGLVELLKGTIKFESALSEGTKFICEFPDVHEVNPEILIREPADELEINGFIDEARPEMPYENVKISSDKPTILLVDDDTDILNLLKDFLPEYNISYAENGVEAYNKILNNPPDLIISDIMMPGMDGIELCCKIRDNFETSHLPLILLTAKAEIEDRIVGLKAGADSYIPKPFHAEHLKVRVQKLLQQRQSIKYHFGKKEDNPALVKEIPDPFFQKMLSFIDENIDDETLSSEKLCDKLAISKSALYNKTRSVLGTTPHSLINQRRLNKAITLLKSTSMTVSEIIDQTGFTSRTYFYDLFNESYGCSPSEYRVKSPGTR